MRSTKRILILSGALVLLSLSNAWGQTHPPPFQVSYELKKGFVKIGEARRELIKLSQDEYLYRSISKTTGMLSILLKEHIVQETRFRFHNNRPRPEKYNYSRKGYENMTVHQNYDWGKKLVFVQVNSDHLSYPIPDDSVDQSVYQLALMTDLINRKTDLTYHMAENRRLKTYGIKFLGNERIDTIYGKLDTVVIRYQDGKNRTTLWCANSLFFLPVQIEYIEDGIKFTAYAQQITGLPNLPPLKKNKAIFDFD